MEIPIYITINLFLFSSWYILLFRSNDSLSFTDRLLGVFVLGLAQIILTEMVLGIIFKELYATPLLALNVSISLAVSAIAIRARGKGGLLTEIVIEIKDKKDRLFNLLMSDWILLAIFVMFSIYFCYLLYIGYLFPSYSWDALLYHLPTVGFILQSGAIENIPYNSLIYTFINVFPKNIDLFFLWNIIFLKSDMIVDLSQLPFTVAGMLAIYGICRKLGIKEKHSAYASVLFFFAPVIMLQSTTNYVDIAVSVLFLIALNFMLCRDISHGDLSSAMSSKAFRFGGNTRLFLAGVTSGILLGSKGSGPLFIIALSALYVINEIRGNYPSRREGSPDKISPLDRDSHGISNMHRTKYLRKAALKMIIARYVLYFMMPVMLLGSYWYISNWVHYGNPVYPFVVKLFGKIIFKGSFSEILHSGPDILRDMSPLKKLFHVWMERVEYYHYSSDMSGFGPLWFILLLPCTVFSVFLSIWKKRLDFLIVAIMIILIFLVYPNNWFTRYVIFLFGLGCLAFGDVAQFFEKKGRTLEYLALLIVVYTLLVSHSPTVTPKKIIEFAHLPAKERSLARLEPYILNMSKRESYGLWSWISSNISEGDTLAYTFTPGMLSPLWNNSFSNKIVFVKAGKFEEWVEELEANNVTYVMVLRKPRSMEAFWLSRLEEMRNNPKWSSIAKQFRLKYHDDNYAVFRFNG